MSKILTKTEKDRITYYLQKHLLTGDIIFRAGDGLFARLLRYITKSKFSHAAIVKRDGNAVSMVELHDSHVSEMRIRDWLDTIANPRIMVCRLHRRQIGFEEKMRKEIDSLLQKDSEASFGFLDTPKAYYCVQAVIYAYKRMGLDLFGGRRLPKIVPWWMWPIVKVCDFIPGTAISSRCRLFYVGNENDGIMASHLLVKFYEYER